MATLTKAELANLLNDKFGLSKHECKEMVQAFFDLLGTALENGDNLSIAGFGNFQLRDKRERPGRNPKTGEAIPITARRVVAFNASATLKTRVLNGDVATSLVGD